MYDPFFMEPSFASLFIGLIFIFIVSVIIFNVVRGVKEYTKNEQSPRLSVPAEVKAKRTKVRSGGQNHHSSTSYYVTFEFSSGDRSELKVSGREFGQLAEGDVGILTFQGTRYVEFERQIVE
ncbi:DUF2500 domain-containing protein [Bacillus weihaiensis]|uniref:DUF2500 domain-containing protein n=1 Tax=Bacillus weihaiensis TaxID=1547283 RepID=UPI0023546E72|nr:DUF2500 domain-containing protein [Bacillus weihaiensis]